MGKGGEGTEGRRVSVLVNNGEWRRSQVGGEVDERPMDRERREARQSGEWGLGFGWNRMRDWGGRAGGCRCGWLIYGRGQRPSWPGPPGPMGRLCHRAGIVPGSFIGSGSGHATGLGGCPSIARCLGPGQPGSAGHRVVSCSGRAKSTGHGLGRQATGCMYIYTQDLAGWPSAVCGACRGGGRMQCNASACSLTGLLFLDRARLSNE